LQIYAILHKFANKINLCLKNKISKAKLATQFIFLVCGLAISSWAPMVPLAKDRLLLNEAELGLLLLLLGGGALFMMPLSDSLSANSEAEK
jgi:hypothetical protein